MVSLIFTTVVCAVAVGVLTGYIGHELMGSLSFGAFAGLVIGMPVGAIIGTMIGAKVGQ